MQQLEGFHYVTAVYLNMVYYNIRLSPASQDTTEIVTEFGKFRYNNLPMGLCTLVDIFQVRVDNLLGDIEGKKTFINDIIFFGEDCFKNHIEKSRIIFRRLCAAGLKVKAHK